MNKNMTHLNQFNILTPKMMLNLLFGMHHISPGPGLILFQIYVTFLFIRHSAGLIVHHSTI